MITNPIYTVPGYQFEVTPDLSRLATRERLSQSAVDGFFAIMDKWRVPVERAGDLLGGRPRSSVYKLKTAAGTLRQDELTRISYVVGIYKALHILLPEDLADQWISRPNDDPLFGGQTPLDYMLRAGIPGLHQVRGLLDAARGGR
ncbi:MAG TPA: MbcA/ParS/Xre antitoxin family protein [Bryobacteraceae bacterium]